MFDDLDITSSDPPTPDADRESLQRLEERICELAGHLAAATCRFLVLLAEFDARQGWATWDMPSCAAWLSWKCQLASGTAREHVRVARALLTLPVIRGEFAAGRLSFAKVRALTRIADADSDHDLAEMAGPMTANQLERFARAHRTVTRAIDEQARLQRRLRWRFEEDGSLSLSVNLPPEDGAAVLTALRAAVRAEQPATEPPPAETPTEEEAGVSAETPAAPQRPTSASLADALVEIAEAYIAGKTRTAQNPDIYQVIVHATPDMLAPGPAGPADPAGPVDAVSPVDPANPAAALSENWRTSRCHIADGSAISRAALQRIACDAVLTWISHDTHGNALNAGRRRRDPTPAIRRALLDRDHGRCRHPGCDRRATQAHHVHWWLYGGITSLDNLISLCAYHHRLVHEGRTVIGAPTPGIFAFYRADGTPLPSSPPPPAPTGRLSDQHDAEVTADTIVPPWYGERLDLDYAIAVLFANQAVREARARPEHAPAA